MIKKIIQRFIRLAQKVLVTLFLIIIYFAGFGITLIFILLFNRKLFYGDGRMKDTFWNEPGDYDASVSDSMRQS